MTLSIEAQVILAALRASGSAVYARDLERTLPGRRRRGVAAILGSLAARGWVRVTPGVGGSAAKYEATKKGLATEARTE